MCFEFQLSPVPEFPSLPTKLCTAVCCFAAAVNRPPRIFFQRKFRNILVSALGSRKESKMRFEDRPPKQRDLKSKGS